MINKIPKVSSFGTEAGKVYVTSRFNSILVKAEKEAKKLKDEYVSIEHIILAFLEEETDAASAFLFARKRRWTLFRGMRLILREIPAHPATCVPVRSAASGRGYRY